MHCHSTCSDGSLPPEEVGRAAGSHGVDVFCLTDHDTLEGYARARDALPEGTRTLPSLELSCKHHGKTVHLLMYGIGDGPGRDRLQTRLDEVRASRIRRIGLICARLEELGAATLEPRTILKSAHGSPGRPHVAAALVKAGAVTSVREAFDRYLKDDGPANVEVDRISLGDGVALGVDAGARMSVAHPHTVGDYERVKDLYRELRDEGLTGIEAYYLKYGAPGSAYRKPWVRLAEEMDLVKTGGSDFHGEATPDVVGPTGVEFEGADAEALADWLGLA